MGSRKGLLLGIGILVLIPVIGIGWWLLSPLLLNKTVEEEFPLASNATIPQGMTRAEVEKKMMEMASVNSEVMDKMPDLMAMDKMPAAGDAMMYKIPVKDAAMPASPVQVKAGAFRDADSFHKGSGQATIYRAPDGSSLLRLENFRVTNGPDLHLLLTPAADPKSRDELTSAGYVDLGKLKGNMGSQNYPIPAGVDVAGLRSVVIYCLPFQVVFSVAVLK
ncbi:MAG: hypothetical protein EXR54_04415 [Dehalococcoidia bacterium]|nr:hypothetical protein [Dehalococcoidia bacterium]MSQ16795.1 hypothetical protein [Dehalococcoidia bacterium]